MSLLQVNNLFMDYSSNVILKDVNFTVNEKDKIGIIGLNGAGKSTLIKIIIGEEFSTTNPENNKYGTISKKNNLRIGYLSQNPNLNMKNIVFEELMDIFSEIKEDHKKINELNIKLSVETENYEKLLEELGEVVERYERNEGYSIEYKVKQVLNSLNLDESIWNLEISKLSGGQLSRLALGKILLEEPELLILDEPTNHLDLSSIEWLEKFLKDYRGALILISHDKYFLDNVCNRIFDLESKTIKSYVGNYTDFVIQKDAYLSGALKSYEKEQEKIKKMEEFIRRYKAGVKSKQARGREKILSRMEKLENPIITTKKIKLKFESKINSVDLVLNISNLTKKFKDKTLFENINMKIYRGDRIGIIGKNGTGKSTLLKMINNLDKDYQGNISIGDKVSIGYYDQTHKGLGENNNILEEIMYDFKMSEEEARNICGAFLFKEDDVFKKISALSGGEKARVAFIKIMLAKPNFIILDEPTNHLDIYSREILEEALENYDGTILTVSHDRNFLDTTVNKIYELDRNGIKIFDGDYESYAAEKEKIKLKNDLSIQNHEQSKKNRNRISILEKKIIEAEKKLNDLEKIKEEKNNFYNLAGKENDIDKMLEISAEIEEIDKKIEEKIYEWENFENELKSLKGE